MGAHVILMFWFADFAVIVMLFSPSNRWNEPNGFQRVTPLTELW
jgi:hypothetical protein